MSTAGYVTRYRVSAYNVHVAPLAGAAHAQIAAAIYAIIPRDELDGDSRELLDEEDGPQALALLFGAACVDPGEDPVCLGKHLTLASFGRRRGALARLFTAWEKLPASIVGDELHVSPAPRALLEEIHAAGGETESDDDALEELLGLVAAVLEEEDTSLAYFWETLPIPERVVGHAPAAWEAAAKKALDAAKLPRWTDRELGIWSQDRPHPVWVWEVAGKQAERVPHVFVDGGGRVFHVIWDTRSGWRRFLDAFSQTLRNPSSRLDPGPCADAACLPCRAAAVVAGHVQPKA
jgi:hypothetical protein